MEKIGVLDKISKISIYLLVFLLPIFFLPLTTNVLDFQKQNLLLVLVSISFLCQVLKILAEGKIQLRIHWFNFFVIFLLFVFGISTLLSKSRIESFFGWPLPVSESFLTLLLLSIFYFLVLILFEKREIFYLFLSFSISLLLATIFATLQIFGKFIFPFNFSRVNYFNTIGTPVSLALLTSATLPLLTILFFLSKKLLKILFLIQIFLSLFLLILINSQIAWLILLFGSVSSVVFLAVKRENLKENFLILPILFLAISIIFLVSNLRIFPVSLPPEVYLGQRISFEIALKSLRENPIFGTGPGTFLYNFSKNKRTSLNNSLFWNFRFQNSASKFFDLLATTGIFGTISFLIFIFSPLYFGFLNYFKPSSEKFDFLLKLGLFLSLSSFFLIFFLYSSNLTLSFTYFLFLATFFSLLFEKKGEIVFKEKYLFNLGFTFASILSLVFLLLILIFSFQRYLAEVYYQKALAFWQEGKIDQTMENLQKAINVNPKIDLYFRDLSQVYLAKANQKIQAGDTNIQNEVAQAINLANSATNLNQINVANWSVRAFNYQSLAGIVRGAEDWAIKCYEEASKLEPSNPYYLTQKGVMILRRGILSENEKEKEEFFTQSEDLFKKAIELKSDYAPAHFQLAMVYYNRGKLDEAISKMEEIKDLVPFDVGLAFQLGVAYYQKGNYQKAKEELERAISLSPDYANALYFLGLTYDQLGEKERAIEKFKRVSQLNPDNEEVKKIISNLEAGKKALEGILPTVPPKTPIEEKPPEIKK
jgi:tetratricopeptide (TPR) repeat protein